MLVYKWVPSISVDSAHNKKALFNRSPNFCNSSNGVFSTYKSLIDSSTCNGVVTLVDSAKEASETVNQNLIEMDVANSEVSDSIMSNTGKYSM